jgi:serine-type D-Ala-D-Ala carboxypeptidase/endopeptidase (penicillin-binding protein 4)
MDAMTTQISRRGILAGLVAGAAAPLALPALAEAPATSPRPVTRGGVASPVVAKAAASADRLVDAAKLGQAGVSYLVMDAQSGVVLEELGSAKPLPPASTAKTITSLYALERLGPGYHYRTRVLATGPLVNGMVQGDLVLAGAGDPTLQTDQLGDLVATLAAKGVKGATGRYLIWSGALPALTQITDDQPVQVGYNPGLSGLNLNFNRFCFEWKRQKGGDWGVAVDARGERFVPAVSMAQVAIVERKAPLFTFAQRGAEEDWTVASGALGKGGSRWLPIRFPERYVAEVFQTLARAQGLRLGAPVPVAVLPDGQELASVQSAPLPDILRDMLKFSTNLTAEAVGLRSSGAADLAGSGAEMTAWVRAKFGVSNSHVDHSGLGAGSRVTAADMAHVLRQARKEHAGLQPILRNVGMRDASGKVMAKHPTKVMAKSGTLNFVSCLVGHILPPNGRELVFAILTGDVARRDSLTLAQREDPPGSAAWIARSRRLQGQLINRWASTYV